MLKRIAEGARPEQYINKPEVRHKASSLGGLAAAKARRKRRAQAVVKQVLDLLTPTVVRGLENKQIAALKVGLVKAFNRGYEAGRFREREHGAPIKGTDNPKRRSEVDIY